MTTLNVLRYTALGAGLVYGFIHVESLKKKGKVEVEKYQFERQEKLVEDAKKEWKLQHPSKAPQGGKIDLSKSDLDWAQVVDDAIKTLDAA
ncbi:DEKNAAC101175 [Brettanomyces naardenensis]|uniref:ATP synthase F(0) complex subunit e, mitochondrial n=1 Tax=Brettanomyces naardenensis TaxID=13370 RepID=A0A448YHH2_BRENA|nr:DEKNAAC101175 [Brettanomyces naardenensis]